MDLDAMESEDEAERFRDRALNYKQEGNMEKAFELLNKSLTLRRQYLNQTHPLILKTLNDLVNWHINAQQWEAALLHCEELIGDFDKNYPPNWPLTGLQYGIAGKLQWYLQRNTTQAVQRLAQAVKVLAVTHGTKHPVYRELANLLSEAEAELSHQKDEEEKRLRRIK